MSVKCVPPQRWAKAQQWELALWSNPQVRAEGDDWNRWWMERFDNYAFLPARVDRYIELGCGPFTNTRLILKHLSADEVVCSDPLARKYAQLSACWLADAVAADRVTLDDHALEDLPFPDASFDVAVMINVLDHVRDADECLRQAVRILRPGGWLVLGQDLSNADDVRNFPYDIGHPIRLELADIEPHLSAFAPTLQRVLPRDEGRNPEGHYATLLFAGTRIAGNGK